MVFASSTLHRVKRLLVQWALQQQVSRLNAAPWYAAFSILESFLRTKILGGCFLFFQLFGNGKTVFFIAAVVIQGCRHPWSLAVDSLFSALGVSSLVESKIDYLADY